MTSSMMSSLPGVAAEPIVARYLETMPKSAALARRAAKVLPGANTRTTTFHPPFALSFARGSGAWLWDVDGNRHFDLFYNGLSIIHGHAYPPIWRALQRVLADGLALGGIGEMLTALAELLQRRLPTAELLRFTNSGTEACMLAVRLARRATGRPLILKAKHAYHGSFHDLEAGLYGIGDLPHRAVLAEFNDIASFERAMRAHAPQIAAIIIEPVMFTGRVVAPQDGFLAAVQELARRHGALFIIDDCLMFRLSPGGSAERFALEPDLTVLGKFLGGGTPMGAVAGRRGILSMLDPSEPDCVFHGGSFNGNIASATAGLIAVEHLTAESIARMEAYGEQLRSYLRRAVAARGLTASITGLGSVAGIAFDNDPSRHETSPSTIGLSALFQIACLNNGVFIQPGGLMALSTATDDGTIAECMAGLGKALDDVARSHLAEALANRS
ncbi:MAG: aspartate aminotransferase family protein [Parvibaculaceae bacterium]